MCVSVSEKGASETDRIDGSNLARVTILFGGVMVYLEVDEVYILVPSWVIFCFSLEFACGSMFIVDLARGLWSHGGG